MNQKEGRRPKNSCLQTVVLEKTPESPLDSKKIKPVNLKGNQPWILVGRTDAETETPAFWSSDMNSWLTGKVPDAGKDGRQKKTASEDKMAGWHCHAMDMNLGKFWEMVRERKVWCAAVHGVAKYDTTGWLNNNNFQLIFIEYLICGRHCSPGTRDSGTTKTYKNSCSCEVRI